jgi:hypothetical protein
VSVPAKKNEEKDKNIKCRGFLKQKHAAAALFLLVVRVTRKLIKVSNFPGWHSARKDTVKTIKQSPIFLLN